MVVDSKHRQLNVDGHKINAASSLSLVWTMMDDRGDVSVPPASADRVKPISSTRARATTDALFASLSDASIVSLIQILYTHPTHPSHGVLSSKATGAQQRKREKQISSPKAQRYFTTSVRYKRS